MTKANPSGPQARGRGAKALPGTPEQWKQVGAAIRRGRLALGWTSAETLADHMPPGSPRVAQIRNYENGFRCQYATTLAAFETVLRLERGSLGQIVGIGAEDMYPIALDTPVSSAVQRRNDLSRMSALERESAQLRLDVERLVAVTEMLAARLQAVEAPLVSVPTTRAKKATSRQVPPA